MLWELRNSFFSPRTYSSSPAADPAPAPTPASCPASALASVPHGTLGAGVGASLGAGASQRWAFRHFRNKHSVWMRMHRAMGDQATSKACAVPGGGTANTGTDVRRLLRMG